MELSSFLKSLARIFEDYTDYTLPEFVMDVLEEVASWELEVRNYTVEEVTEGYLITAQIPMSASTPHSAISGMPGWYFSLNRPDDAAHFYLKVIVPYEVPTYMILKDTELSIRYDSNVLREDDNALVIRVKADIKVDDAFGLTFLSYSAYCQQTLRFFGTVISFAFEGFRFSFDDETNQIPFSALPEGQRKGLFAERVRLAIPAGGFLRSNRPLELVFRELYITRAGVSFSFAQFFYANISNGLFDPANEMICQLLSPGWSASVTSAHGKVVHNVFEYFRVEGLIKIPLFNFFVRFRLALTWYRSRLRSSR
jgi:hypothetical protein